MFVIDTVIHITKCSRKVDKLPKKPGGPNSMVTLFAFIVGHNCSIFGVNDSGIDARCNEESNLELEWAILEFFLFLVSDLACHLVLN